MQFNKYTHTHTHTHTPWEDQCEWHIMTRMTGPDCAVMCNLINTHRFDCCTPFPPPSFYPVVLALALSSYLGCLAPFIYVYGCLSCPTHIICGCPGLFCFCSLVFPPPESLPGDDVLCRLLPRPLPSVCFLFFSFLFRPCSSPICISVTSSIL